MSKTKLQFVHHPHPSPVPADKRAELLKNPGFGRVFSDHMVTIRYHESKGWHDARIEPRGADPDGSGGGRAALRAGDLRGAEGLPRPRTAARPCSGRSRMRGASSSRPSGWPCRACRRSCSSRPCDQLVKTDRDWIPDGDGGSLYLRPFMFANEIFLGVKPSSDYLFIVIASSVGSYFKADAPAVSLWVSQEYTRAAPGGTGAAKCGGNYAASLLAQAEATRHGCDQVVFLDAVEQQVGRGAGRHEHLLRVRRRLDGRRRRSAARSCPASPAPRCSRSPRTRASRCARSAIRSTSGAADAAQRPPARGLRLRHRRRGHADRHRRAARTASSRSATAAPARRPRS